ncbi:hypothetical protein FQZ97_949250 [compost metagenome]
MPAGATIGGGEGQPIGAEDHALLLVEEVHGQKGFVRPLLEQQLRRLELLLALFAGLGAVRALRRLQLQARGLLAIQLFAPAQAAVL